MADEMLVQAHDKTLNRIVRCQCYSLTLWCCGVEDNRLGCCYLCAIAKPCMQNCRRRFAPFIIASLEPQTTINPL